MVGITFIYTVSGVAMNHRRDWNPHYSVVSEEIKAPVSDTSKNFGIRCCYFVEKFSISSGL